MTQRYTRWSAYDRMSTVLATQDVHEMYDSDGDVVDDVHTGTQAGGQVRASHRESQH